MEWDDLDKKDMPIGFLDSGVGGLSVMREAIKIMPNENYIYLGDTKYFPYGEKNRVEIIIFAIQNVEYLIKKNVKIIVIACGTATSRKQIWRKRT